jgi:hypothetical protein
VDYYTTPPAAPDLQAELEATNRQVEILSDALAESRREVAQLKAVQDWKKLPPEEPPLVKWAKEQPAPVQEPKMYEDWYDSSSCGHCGMVNGHRPECRHNYKTPAPAPVQEPVAWLHRMDNTEGIKANGKGIVSITQKRKHPFGKPGVDFSKSFPVTSTPLYTTQPAAQRQWVGLTEREVDECYESIMFHPDIEPSRVGVYFEIEAKLKEKNT